METTDKTIIRLKNGRCLIDDVQSTIFTKIRNAHPHFSNDYSWSELSMTELFVDCYKENARYCPEAKSWYTYNGSIWIKDTQALLVMDKLQEFVKLLNIYASDLDDSEQIDLIKYKTFTTKLLDRRVRERMLKDASNLTSISLSDFDKNPYLINCENGTYDLDNDSFHFHTYEDYITLKTNCIYIIPTAEINYSFDRWNQFIQEIMNNNKDKAAYLQRALGYSLLGENTEECMFVAWGKTTRNGKGTLFNTILHLLGDYATSVSSSLICKSKAIKNANQATPALAALRGRRFIVMSEVNKDTEFDEEIIKEFTGNDAISGRELYGTLFTFVLQGTFWLMCNDLPKTVDMGLIASDRLKIIEFDKHFDSSDRDTTLKAQFQEKIAKAVIFKWLIDGYKMYKKEKLNDPKEVKDTLNYYELKNDIVKRFVNDCCVNDKNSKILKTELRTYFESWRKRLDLPSVSKQSFYNDIERYYKEITITGYAYFKGVSIKEDK